MPFSGEENISYSGPVADLWDDLLACLDLDTLPGADGADGTVRFEGKNLHLEYHRLFGGQLLGQFVAAALLSCADSGKSVKSLHVLFPREGRADEPVRYTVERHHEGGTFATLAVTARQSRGVIATASVSMHAAEEGPARQSVAPVRETPAEVPEAGLSLLPFEARSEISLDARDAAPPEYSLWIRTPPVSPRLAPAVAAYATDLTLIGTALRAVPGVSQADAGTAFASAVTSHTVWFHRPFRTDSWLLLRQQGPVLAHGRCFGRGDLLTADGTLVASYAQEALLRIGPRGPGIAG
jgi:acyl-CoA thioesterase II